MTTILESANQAVGNLQASVLEPQQFERWPAVGDSSSPVSTYALHSLRWLKILRGGLHQDPYCIQLHSGSALAGVLPLLLVKSRLFGRYLVSLPYVNSAGVASDSEDITRNLIDRAVELADRLNVRYLELRNEQEVTHGALTEKNDSKVLMRLALPDSSDLLWSGFKSKLRSQVKAGEKHGFGVRWGRLELLPDFYQVFAHNMRDLGTPVYSRKLFKEILTTFASEAEICVVDHQGSPAAAALLIHREGATEVPSASALRKFNGMNANMVMYWNLLKRAVSRGQRCFDFGRSSVDSGTYRFKQQWGADAVPSVWQYYLRQGSIRALRPDNAQFSLAIKIWQRLPVSVTKWIGPSIVRGIP